jgi:hypothetical protein
VKRAGVAVIVVLAARIVGLIAEGRRRVVADLAAATVLAEGRAKAAAVAVQAGTVEPPIAGLDHMAVIGSRGWRRQPDLRAHLIT